MSWGISRAQLFCVLADPGSQVRLHYAMVDGEYQQTATPESEVKDWLEENNLTWQKGFPSHSECPGEEGELIPEMHDPLLNDADVLQ